MLTFFLGSALFAQGGWKVRLGWNVILDASAEDTAKNVAIVDAGKLRALTLVYLERSIDPGWERFLAVYDENDREVLQQKGKQLRITRARLSSLLKASPTLKFYTWALPSDPNEKARVKVRRLHLCTLRTKTP